MSPVFGAHLDQLVERLIVRRPAVRIPRTVLLHRANKHRLAPSTSAQLTAAERKCALRNGTYVTGTSLPMLDSSAAATGTAIAVIGQRRPANPPEQVDLQLQQLPAPQ